MDIRETKTKMLKVADLRPNTGQIEGVPSNPRSITRAEFDALCESMKADDLTGVLQVKVYKHAGEWVVLDGNMRLKAMQTIGIEEVQCVIVPEGTNAATLRKIVINSNSTFGEWDMDMLANEWDDDELRAWAVAIPTNEIDQDALIDQASSGDATREYSDDIKYDLSNLYRSRVNDAILAKIDEGVRGGQIRKEIADILQTRAQQCSIFNFDQICKFYRSSDPTPLERELLRRLYLVFVAPKELFEEQVLKITELSNLIYDDELLRNKDDAA